ncbi:MAG: nitrate reductase cytochrome c-type subunit [Gammaproteobacteria bacterium]|nr:nitrate reductase cytochrome c-type subunit [Gammaproteobacteria bacterium]MBL6999692.1 nitrate reductase cytochrome c-type subunit [Gammaproteobacteria bacterium]
MKTERLFLLTGVVVAIFGCSQVPLNNAAESAIVDDINMGLSKESVFDTPTPMVSHYSGQETGENERLPVAYSTLPSQVAHTLTEYLPITREENECIDCHDRRKYIGYEWKMGVRVPMPDSHYGSFKVQGESEDVAGARYNCTLCHVQMSDAQPLVGNTFSN